MDDRYSYIPLYLAIIKSRDSTVTTHSIPIYPIYIQLTCLSVFSRRDVTITFAPIRA